MVDARVRHRIRLRVRLAVRVRVGFGLSLQGSRVLLGDTSDMAGL